MARKTVNFKSKAGYKRWLAYGHMHKVFHGKMRVKVRGKVRRVRHGR